MNISDRVFTYPILNSYKDDYDSSSFEANLEYNTNTVNSINVTVKYGLKCPEIKKLIEDGFAEFVLHIECSTTGYRIVYKSDLPVIVCDIPLPKINGRIEMLAMIVAKKDISSYKASDFNEDFGDNSFDLPRASIIAFENLPTLDVSKNYEEFGTSESIFSIYRIIDDTDKPMLISMEENKIKLGLNNTKFALYRNLAAKPSLKYLLHSMIIFPALVYVFEELSIEGVYESFEDKNWLRSLEYSFEAKGMNLREKLTLEKASIFELAQVAMELPVSKALESIPLVLSEHQEG